MYIIHIIYNVYNVYNTYLYNVIYTLYNIVCIFHIFLIDLSVNALLSFSYLLAILNNAAINSGVLESLQYHDLTGGRISRSCGKSF